MADQHRAPFRHIAPRALVTLGVTALVALAPGVASAGTDREPPVTPATGFHGLPGNNGGFSDQTKGAAPATAGRAGGDGGIHGIATNPGQSGISPSDRSTPPSCDMHAGLDAANQNC